MNVYTDKHLEARALKRGAPEGPRMLPRVTCDDEGMFTIYTGKMCRVCYCQLTSRNRFGASLLCMNHGRQAEKERIRRPGGAARAQAKRMGQASEAWVDPCPHRQAVRSALDAWLNSPTDPAMYAYFLEVMHNHELRARLLNAIPPTDALDASNESNP